MSNKYDDIRKILFIRLGNIRDIAHTTITYQTIKQNMKNVHIDILTSSLMQELVNNDNHLHQIISLDDSTYDGIFRLAMQLTENHYDLVVNLQPTLKTRFFTAILNKRHVLTFKNNKNLHNAENFFNLIHPLIPDVERPKQLNILLNQDTKKWAKNCMEKEKITHAIGIVPGSSSKNIGKLWPNDHWKDLLDYITNQKGLHAILFGGTNEFDFAKELQKINKDKIRNFSGKLTISQTAGVLSSCMVVIGCNTGPTHLATGLGPKVIGLYGSTGTIETGLYGIGHEMLISNNDCISCNNKNCKYIKNLKEYA
ncbi:MAG: glycosyltransferase family 9 protein, partial [Vampirovibrionia bacterium]